MSDSTEKDVREIKWRVEGIDKSIDLLVRASRKQIIADILEFFGKSKDRVNVFLAIDGNKTVDQVAKELNMKEPNVSRRITELRDEGLVNIKKITKNGYIYEKTEKVRVLSIEKVLAKKAPIIDASKVTIGQQKEVDKAEQ
jgi:predicted transcriptional regulator